MDTRRVLRPHEPVSARPTADVRLGPGTRVAGRYEIEGQLGRGGFGTVYRAHDHVLGRPVAVKVLHPDRTPRSFAREARTLARLDHPNVVTVFDVVFDADRHHVVTSLVEGTTLAARLDSGPLPWPTAARIGAAVARALEHAHARGVLHRDVKPANVLLTSDGEVKVTDFGTALLVDTLSSSSDHDFAGTLTHAAPEALREEPVGPAADVYSLGVLLFQSLTGRLPFEREVVQALLRQVQEENAPRVSSCVQGVPAVIDELVARCLEKRPEDRPPAAAEIADRLEALIAPAARDGAAHVPPGLSTASVLAPEEGDRKRLVMLRIEERHLDDLSDEWPADRMSALRSRVASELFARVAAHGGMVHDVRYGRTDVLFGLPAVQELDADRAVSCGRAVLDALHGRSIDGATLRLAAAVHSVQAVAATGDRRYEVRAESMRTAERLAALAADGDVLASTSIVTSTRGRLRFSRRGELSDPEPKDSSTAVFRLERGAPATTEASVTPLVGRSAELALLLRAHDETRARQSVVVTVEAEAGLGKTRLVAELVDRLQRAPGAPSAWLARAGTGGVATVHQLFRALLEVMDADPLAHDALRRELSDAERAVLAAQATGDWGSEDVRHLDGDERADALRAAWTRWLAAATRERRAVVVLEDLHWADAPSLQLLGRLVATPLACPVLFVLTHRPQTRLGLEGRSHHRPVVLGRLTADEEAELVRRVLSVDALPDELRHVLGERTDGSPLYVIELVRTLVDRGFIRRRTGAVEVVAAPTELEAPATIQGILASRIDQLDPPAKRLLQVASTLGREFPVSWLARVLGESRGDTTRCLEQLARHGLLHARSSSDDASWSFAHALVHEVVHDGILRGRRRAMHAAVVKALEELHPTVPDSVVATLAHHAASSDQPTRAIPYLRRSAELSLAAGDVAGALTQAREALRLAGDAGGPPALGVEARMQVARLLGWTDAVEDGLDEARSALAEAQRADDRRLIAECHAAVAWLMGRLSRQDEALEHLALADRHAREAGATHLEARMLATRAGLLIPLGRVPEAEEALDRVDALGSSSGGQRVESLRLRAEGVFQRGDSEGALGLVDEALRASLETPHRSIRYALLSNRCTFLLALGRYREALETTRLARQECERLGLYAAQAYVLALEATVHRTLGDLGKADAAARGACEVAEATGSDARWVTAAWTRAVILHDAGRHAEASASLEQAARRVEGLPSSRWRTNCLVTHAHVEATLGRPDRADAFARQGVESARRLSDPFGEVDAAVALARARRLAGASRAAVECGDEIERSARRLGEADTLIPTLAELARCEAAGGDARRAVALAQDATQRAEQAGRRTDLARAMLAAAEAWRSAGELERAAGEAEAAARLAAEIGLPEAIWQAEALLGGLAGLADERRRAARARALAAMEGVAAALPAELAAAYLARPDRAALQRSALLL